MGRPLSEILGNVTPVDGALGALAIEGVSTDSRSVRPGDLFVALRGDRTDGHAFLQAVARSGAAAALVERDISPTPLPCVRVPSTTSALPAVAAAFHGDPSANLAVIGVTGTNGKTTVTYLLESILAAAGFRSLVIGSIDYRLGGEVLRTGLTTPFPHDLQAVMARGLAMGATHVVMEVSSHAAAQGRVAGVRFDAGVFTNLSHDHLDFHGDMESYFLAKARFFREFLPAGGKRTGMALNTEDPYGKRLAGEYPDAVTFGTAGGNAVHPVSVDLSLEGARLRLATPGGILAVSSNLIGSHNVSNVLAAVAVAHLLGIRNDAVAEGVARLAGVPGRMEKIPNRRGIHVFVDYAHTPDGLDRVLGGLRALTGDRLISVFGCGGNRDRTKRPEMGQAAARRSDLVLITSDNPRSEDPLAIIGEIVPGVVAEGLAEGDGSNAGKNGTFEVIPDRKSAIRRALDIARPGDAVVIAGKGHEHVQIIGDRSLPFDDREAVRAVLASGG
ncbi:MAG TPA: UDP-N-acetylmuramoyl-L-alanyl-D-glutamate--2,6-diaminopimelate ligase [Candidatus Deferrimicrobiaceae bacterium]